MIFNMGIFIGIYNMEYILSEKAKDALWDCLIVIGIILFVTFQIFGVFQTCSDASYNEKDPYDDIIG